MTAEQRFFPIWKMCLCAAVVLSLMGCAAKHGDKAVNSPDVQAVETSSVGAASVADSDSAFEDYDDEESEAIADPLVPFLYLLPIEKGKAAPMANRKKGNTRSTQVIPYIEPSNTKLERGPT